MGVIDGSLIHLFTYELQQDVLS